VNGKERESQRIYDRVYKKGRKWKIENTSDF
jgi:hypothetical protein